MVKRAQRRCEVRTHIGCNDVGLRKMTGPEKGDPVFWCCIGCAAYLRRRGVRLKEVVQ